VRFKKHTPLSAVEKRDFFFSNIFKLLFFSNTLK